MQDLNILAQQISDASRKFRKELPKATTQAEQARIISYDDQVIGATAVVNYLLGEKSEDEWQDFLKGGLA